MQKTIQKFQQDKDEKYVKLEGQIKQAVKIADDYSHEILNLTKHVDKIEQEKQKLKDQLAENVTELKTLKDNLNITNNQKVLENQLRGMSDVFGILQKFVSPDTDTQGKESALNGLSEQCSSLRHLHQQIDKVAKEETRECQICCVKFSEEMNLMYCQNDNQTPEFLNDLSSRLSSNHPSRRITLSCGHNIFHQKCMKQWLQNCGKTTCPVCRKQVENSHQFL